MQNPATTIEEQAVQNFDLSWMLDPKFILGSLWAGMLVLGGALAALVRGRIRLMQYTVHHNPLGVTLKDEQFGDIQVSYRGSPISKLWLTRVELTNDSGKDFEGLEVRVYTKDDTLLLGERTELSVAGFEITHAEGYKQKLFTAPDTKPTPAQWKAYMHERDYAIPVLNRGDRATWFILTTLAPVAQGAAEPLGPSVWVSIQHAGARVQYRHRGQEVHGVPVKTAAALGVLATLAAYALACYFFSDRWLAAAPAAFVALFGQSVGAAMYKAFRLVVPLVAR